MKRSLLAAAVSAVFLCLSFDGCFTEIGNAEGENKIRADFKIDYTRPEALPKGASGPGEGAGGKPAAAPLTHDTVIIDHFYLLVREAEYHLKGGGERHLWRESDSGLPVDFTGRDTLAILPVRPIEPDSILDFKLECRIPRPPALQPDSLDIITFHELGFVRGTYSFGGASVPFLFALPEAEHVNIRYPPSTFESWRKGSAYEMQVVFYALKWMSHAGIEKAKHSKDRQGTSFVLIDSLHNADLHRILSERFFLGFNTADVEKG